MSETSGADPELYSLAATERIGFLGGSFDPPHLGHLAIAHAARKALQLDQVLLAPTGRQPLKSAGAEASFADRLAMVRLLCASDPGSLVASEVDKPRADGEPNYTVDALLELQASSPGARLYGIVGEDSFAEMPCWRAPHRLLALAEWIVVSRPGAPAAMTWVPVEDRKRVHPVGGVAVPFASRDLRRRLHAGDSCCEAIPEAILAYIRRHGIYGTS